MSEVKLQSPGATLDYSGDWSDFLAAGESIVTSGWVVYPEDATLADQGVDGALATVMLSGLTVNKLYRLTNTITTNSSPARIGAKSFTIRVAQL